MPDVENLAGQLYEKYCVAVGGKAFNGDSLNFPRKSDPFFAYTPSLSYMATLKLE